MSATVPIANSAGPYLVTGSAGFIGSHLVEALLARGERVVGIDCFDDFYDPVIKRRNSASAMASENFRLVEGDVRDRELMDCLLREERIATVVHLAARAGVRPSIADPTLYESVNVGGTAVLLEAMRAAGIGRLLFASSSSVYGNNPSVPFREEDYVDRPISPYAATKRAGELMCYAYHHLFGFDVACLRFFTVYGPRQRPEMAIHRFVRLALEGMPIPLYGNGTTSRDYTYIEDIVQGVLCIERGLSGYCVVNLGESAPIALRDLVDVIGRVLGRDVEVEYFPDQAGDVERTYADITVARSFGYEPTVSIEEGIRRVFEWCSVTDLSASTGPGVVGAES